LQARNILQGAKDKADQAFSEAQKTGNETTGQARSGADGPSPLPAISQVSPDAPEASDPYADKVASRADVRSFSIRLHLVNAQLEYGTQTSVYKY
jgi:hypothetical protein